MSISLEIRGINRLQAQISRIRLSPYERMHVNRAMGRKVSTFSKQRISLQKTLFGAAFAPRKKRGKGKMLKGLRSRMKVQTAVTGSVVTWSGGKVAYKHQHGWTESMTARKLAARERTENPGDESSAGGMATKSQARALLAAGYRIPRHQNGGNSRRPNQGWITSHLSKKQAGKILRILRGASPQQWEIKLPSREFLGANRMQQTELRDYLSEQIVGRLARRR